MVERRSAVFPMSDSNGKSGGIFEKKEWTAENSHSVRFEKSEAREIEKEKKQCPVERVLLFCGQ
jgi:hypothetical protein